MCQLNVAMPKTTRRSHFIAQFYLRNFAEPMFSDNLCFYDLRKQRWESRTPKGFGWFPHLYSLFDVVGIRTDSFEKLLSKQVEDPAAPALKKLATGESLDDGERSAVALFVALTAARSPEMMNEVVTAHIEKLTSADRDNLNRLVNLWCELAGRPYNPSSHDEFLKPSTFGALLFWSVNLQNQLLEWEWCVVRTTRDQPFVTSDRPVYMCREQDVRLVSFPVSSEIALVIIAGGQFNEARDRSKEAWAINRQTMDRANEFVVTCKKAFPANDFVTARGQHR